MPSITKTITAVALFAVTQAASAALLSREVVITPSLDQVVEGTFGSGSFWRPTFNVDPMTVSGAGDSIELTVRFPVGYRLVVDAGAVEQESVGGAVFRTDSYQVVLSSHVDSWSFLDPMGDFLVAGQTGVQGASEGGIGAGFTVDLTDTSFSIAGIRLRFDISSDSGNSGFPALFNAGMVAIQTQGAFAVMVDEPASLPLFGAALVSLLVLHRKRRKAPANRVRCPRRHE